MGKLHNNPPYKAWRVKEEFVHHMPKTEYFAGMEYPIFTDDELSLDTYVLNEDGTKTYIFTKVAPGLAIGGIKIHESLVEEYEEERYWEIS